MYEKTRRSSSYRTANQSFSRVINALERLKRYTLPSRRTSLYGRSGAILIGIPAPTGAFAIRNQSGEAIVTIYHDGRVVVNPAFLVDDAAAAFWEAVIRLNPAFGGQP